VGRFEEVVSAVRSLLQGEHVTVAGKWIQLEDAVLLPPPEWAVPLLIASHGPRMLEITARFADAWEAAWYGLPDETFRGERAALLEACRSVGRATPIETFVGVDFTYEESDGPHLPID